MAPLDRIALDLDQARPTHLLVGFGFSEVNQAGTGTFATAVMTIARRSVRLKPGGEGIFCAALPEMGLGIALMISDGAEIEARLKELADSNDPAF